MISPLQGIAQTGKNPGTRRSDFETSAAGGVEAFGLKTSVAGNDFPVTVADIDGLSFFRAVENNLDLFPGIAVGIVFQRVADQKRRFDFVEHKVAGDILGLGHAERGMGATQFDKFLVVVELVGVGGFQVPVNGIDFCWRLIGVVNAFFIISNEMFSR